MKQKFKTKRLSDKQIKNRYNSAVQLDEV